MNILSPWEPGSWPSFWLHFGPWGLTALTLIVIASILGLRHAKIEAKRRALRAWHLGRLEVWREKRLELSPTAQREIETFTQQIEVVVVPASESGQS